MENSMEEKAIESKLTISREKIKKDWEMCIDASGGDMDKAREIFLHFTPVIYGDDFIFTANLLFPSTKR